MIWLFLIFRFLAWMMSVVFCHSVFVMFQTSFTEFGHLSSSMQGKNWYFFYYIFLNLPCQKQFSNCELLGIENLEPVNTAVGSWKCGSGSIWRFQNWHSQYVSTISFWLTNIDYFQYLECLYMYNTQRFNSMIKRQNFHNEKI